MDEAFTTESIEPVDEEQVVANQDDSLAGKVNWVRASEGGPRLVSDVPQIIASKRLSLEGNGCHPGPQMSYLIPPVCWSFLMEHGVWRDRRGVGCVRRAY